MRETIIIGIVVGAIFFAAGAIVSSLAIKYATSSYLWDAVLWGGVALMLCSLITLGLYISSQLGGRPFVLPSLLINFGLCLVVGGLVWHFGYGNASPKPNASLLLKETGRFFLDPGKKKAFVVDNTNPKGLTYKEAPPEANIAKSNNNEPFNVLSAYVHDSLNMGSDTFVISSHADLELGADKFRIYYYFITEFRSNSRFFSAYIPHSPHTFATALGLAVNYQSIIKEIDNQIGADFGRQGQSGISRSWEIKFSGLANLYTDDQFDPRQMGDLSRAFSDNGASVHFFSTDYVLAAWHNIRLGLATPIDLYELRGNPPEIVPVISKPTP